MRTMKCLLAAVLLLFCGTSTVANENNPMEKVIRLIEGLLVHAEAQGKVEEVLYLKFEYWCTGNAATLAHALEKEAETIQFLQDKLGSESALEGALRSQVVQLQNQIVEQQGAEQQAEEDRVDERSLYEKASYTLKNTIHAFHAVEVAIEALERGKSSTEALVQMKTNAQKILALASDKLTERQSQMIQKLANGQPDDEAMARKMAEAPKSDYNFHSNSVIDVLKQLQDKLQADFNQLVREETGKAATFEQLKQALEEAIATEEEAEANKQAGLTNVQAEETQDQADLTTAEQQQTTDQANKNEKEQICAMKKSEYNERVETRTQEMKALLKAKEIVAKIGNVRVDSHWNDEIGGARFGDGSIEVTSFLQIEDPRKEAVQFLRQQSTVLHSKALSRLAQEVQAHLNSPFGTITEAMQRLIWRLQEEQTQENKHKEWCDQEYSKTNLTMDNKQDKLDEENHKIAQFKARMISLTDLIAESNEMVADIRKKADEALEVREGEKKENLATIADAEKAVAGLSQAIAVLEEHYKESGAIPKQPWEFLQTGKALPDQPSTWDASYTGVTDPNRQPTGIVALLKEVSAKYSKMEAETKAMEQEDQNAYDKDKSKNDIETARLKQLVETKGQEKKRVIDKMTEAQAKAKSLENEIYKINIYIKDLSQSCANGDSSYEERKAARRDEMDAIKRAEKLLRDADYDKQSNAQKILRGAKPHLF